MKMYFYRGAVSNFGDELNDWMWPQLLPNFFDQDERTIFLGIGSVIFNTFPESATKIVFGAGYGGYTQLPVLDQNWKVYFVRGAKTAEKLGLDKAYGVGDSGILVRSCHLPEPTGQYAVSFMPHWESAIRGDWETVCKTAGIHYIDPCGSVDQVLGEIRASRLVLTEAMHGAIISDALRVPWIPLQPIQGAHRMKWFDWASALDIDLRPHALPVSNVVEYAVRHIYHQGKWARLLQRNKKTLNTVTGALFVDRAAQALTSVAKQTPSLSSDSAIDRAHDAMLEHLHRLKMDFGARAA